MKSVHVIYTQVEPDICTGETFREAFLEPSCECCGSDDHAMLQQTNDPQHRTGFKYACPVAIYRKLDKNFPKYPINLDFYACPRKFAELYHYTNDERLEAALEKYRTMSAARIDYTYSQNFIDEVERLCEEHQLSLTFKRRRLGGSDDEQDQETESEADEHTRNDGTEQLSLIHI